MFPIVHNGMNVFSLSSVFSGSQTTFSAHKEEDQGIGNSGQRRPGQGRWAEAFVSPSQRPRSELAALPRGIGLDQQLPAEFTARRAGWMPITRGGRDAAWRGQGCACRATGAVAPDARFGEESAPGSDEEVVGGLLARWCWFHQSGVGLCTIPASSCAHLLLFQRSHPQLCRSPIFPGFLTQGVSRQMLRLAKIPNSRCLAKNQNKQGKKIKIKIPRPTGPSSVEAQLLAPARRWLQAVRLPA